MSSTSNSNVYLTANAAPLPVSQTTCAQHQFSVDNYNPWPAEVIDSVVSVVSATGLSLDSQRGHTGVTWRPGRLGIIRKNGSSNPVVTVVRKDSGTMSAGEDVEVIVTFRRAGVPGRPVPSQAVSMSLSTLVSIV
jgi:hypothetical protein